MRRRLRGAGPNAVLALGGVAVEGDMDWVTPAADAAKHPVGYVVAAHQAGFAPARGLTVKAPYTLRVPAGAPGYDLGSAVAVTTTGVWWGHPLGPLPGQVRDPAKHTDTAPAGAAPACARAETP